MRRARIKGETGLGCYHVVSRVVDRTFRMDDNEKEIFRCIMRKTAGFSGIEILTYAVLSNHFHILARVPRQPELGERELLGRVAVLYGEARAEMLRAQWAGWKKKGLGYLAEKDCEALRRRMGDLSLFLKLLKQDYSISYNARHGRVGTLWEGRFNSVLVEDTGAALSAFAAYIDLNAVRAGIVGDPAEYRWCGYGEAVAGSGGARDGIRSALWAGPEKWAKVQARYRALLYEEGAERRRADGSLRRRGFTPEEIQKVLASGGELTLPQLLRCRVRYFTASAAFGSKAFVEGVFAANRPQFGAKRKAGAKTLAHADWKGMAGLRLPRKGAVTVPEPLKT